MKELEKSVAWRNVGAVERWASAIGGGAIVAYAMMRRDKVAIPIALTGSALALIGASGYCPCYAAAGIDTTGETGIEVDRSVTINRPANELYRFWRKLETLPSVMDHLKSVTMLDDARSHWVVSGPAGKTVEWDAVITDDDPNRKIAWRSMEDADVESEGRVTFQPAPGKRGTVVRVVLRYVPPAGIEGALFAKLFGEEPAIQLEQDLHRFKQMMETGEIPTTAGQPHGRSRKRQVKAAVVKSAA
jgi:uncharacterized membrane protein